MRYKSQCLEALTLVARLGSTIPGAIVFRRFMAGKGLYRPVPSPSRPSQLFLEVCTKTVDIACVTRWLHFGQAGPAVSCSLTLFSWVNCSPHSPHPCTRSWHSLLQV